MNRKRNESVICTLRVCNKTFDVVKFLKKNKWKVNNFWVKGEKDSVRGKISKDSGFNIDICTAKNKKIAQVPDRLARFLKKNKKALSGLKFGSLLDLGIFQSEKIAWKSVLFTPNTLKELAAYNIELVFSFY